ncbi:hypothetical protein BDP27DRAFT_91732 [Rhodocollybia butyracea]|uniref:Uncharacterized protein n=1 Tax=Rhodocollybia butyracea TaxID=206335 RepID=A0A9P5UD86_9AGAR|nr:hypothetical protein BDP27DRAFT_91732 [Rhodocollybia butyracea]
MISGCARTWSCSTGFRNFFPAQRSPPDTMSILTLGMNDISENMQATKDKLSSKDAQIAAQQGQLLKKAAELEEMKQSLNDALQKLNNETSRVLQLEASLVRVNADLQSSNLTSQNTSTALAFAEEKFRLKDLEARDLENALVSLSHDSDGHQSRLAKMETEKRKLEARVKELESASRIHNAPTTPWTPARARSSSLSDVRIHALESDLTELRTTLSSRDTELHAIQTKLDAVQRDALRANNEYMASEARLRNRIKELDELVVEKEDELQYLKQQGGTGGLEREEELLKRIDEDDAKIEALEMIIGEARDLPALKERLRKSEERLGSEALRIGQLEDRNIELVQEKEQALDEVEVAKAKIGELEAQNRLFSAEVQNLQNQPPSGTDRETVENMERLLNAVERLRGERDGLRRDLEFLNMESKFTITALETRITTLSSSSAPPSVTIPSIFITDTTADAITSEKEQKEHRRLRGIVLGSAIVIGHLERDRTDMEARCNSAYSAHEEMAHRYSLLETRLHEAEARLTTSMQLLEETTVHRNDALARLSSLDTEWRTKFDDANAAQQESRNTVDHLNAQLVEISKIVEAVTSERDSLHVQVANLNSDIASARQELTDAESRYTQLQFHQLSDMPSTQATKTLRSQIEELEGRVMRRTEQVGIHQHDIRRLETNLRLQEERLTEMTTEMEMILAQKDAMVEDCADAREQRDEAILNVERLEEEVERLESLLEDRGREQEAIIEVMFLNSARTKEKMNVDAGQIDAMRARMQSLLDDRDNTLHSVQSLNEALEEAKQRLQSSEDGARRMSESLALSQQELTHSIMSTQDLDRVKIDLSKKVSDLEHQLESRIAEATALASKLNSLEKESTAAISRGTATITDLESQVEESRSLLASKEGEHRRMVEELQRQLAQKDQLVVHNDLEGELVQLKMKHVEELGQLQSRLVEANTAFDELQARHDSVQLELKQSLADSAESKDEVEQQLKNATEELNGLKEMKENLEAIGREQVEQVQRLEERVAVLDSELSVARSEQEEIDSSLRHAVDDLAETRLRFEGLLSEARDELFETRTLLDEESTAVNQLREQVSALQQKVNDEVQERAQDQSSHEQELQSISRLHQQAESRVEELVQQISTLEANIEKTDAAVQNLHGEKKATERDMTALEANFQRSLSMTRHLESQIHERARASQQPSSEG